MLRVNQKPKCKIFSSLAYRKCIANPRIPSGHGGVYEVKYLKTLYRKDNRKYKKSDMPMFVQW